MRLLQRITKARHKGAEAMNVFVGSSKPLLDHWDVERAEEKARNLLAEHDKEIAEVSEYLGGHVKEVVAAMNDAHRLAEVAAEHPKRYLWPPVRSDVYALQNALAAAERAISRTPPDVQEFILASVNMSEIRGMARHAVTWSDFDSVQRWLNAKTQYCRLA